ncbi:hypothetical protein TSMEX_000850 [Taenia solium]|eukprot:TsM_000354100 transcript=TsM_000354100 gene=TsM_000354100
MGACLGLCRRLDWMWNANLMSLFINKALKALSNLKTHSETTVRDCHHNVFSGDIAGMQNNLIACMIIVFLCIIASCVVGSVSVLARRVPAAMVNAFLYLTACKSTTSKSVFITFANCIEHIKVNHIQSKWGPCYPIVRLPPDLYDPTLIRVQYGWTVFVNWVVAGVFLASTCAWFVLKQVLYVETTKTVI